MANFLLLMMLFVGSCFAQNNKENDDTLSYPHPEDFPWTASHHSHNMYYHHRHNSRIDLLLKAVAGLQRLNLQMAQMLTDLLANRSDNVDTERDRRSLEYLPGNPGFGIDEFGLLYELPGLIFSGKKKSYSSRGSTVQYGFTTRSPYYRHRSTEVYSHEPRYQPESLDWYRSTTTATPRYESDPDVYRPTPTPSRYPSTLSPPSNYAEEVMIIPSYDAPPAPEPYEPTTPEPYEPTTPPNEPSPTSYSLSPPSNYDEELIPSYDAPPAPEPYEPITPEPYEPTTPPYEPSPSSYSWSPPSSYDEELIPSYDDSPASDPHDGVFINTYQ